MILVVKIGSTSLTNSTGNISIQAIAKLSSEIAKLRADGVDVVVVSSAATSVGLKPLGYSIADKPSDAATLRAAAAIGQITITGTYRQCLSTEGLEAAQILLAPLDFWNRKRYLSSRELIKLLLDRGIVPIINENDALADQDINFGDNDNLAALVAHLLDADKLVLLTDIDGFYSADPSTNPEAELIRLVDKITSELYDSAGGSNSDIGRGGMASKLSAAQIASRSGVETVICNSAADQVLSKCINDNQVIGTTFEPHSKKVSARKLWIGFALAPSGKIVVDDGAKNALVNSNKSLLAAGMVSCSGDFSQGKLIEISDINGRVFARGLTRWSSKEIISNSGKQSADTPNLSDEVVHKDDLVLLGTIS